MTPTSYDQVPYPNLSHSRSHPDHLATLATLLGLAPAPVEHCRALELGCAGGGNLIPMAYGLPESEWVGIDNSQRQIADAQTAVAALGLKNATFEQRDVLDITPDFGQFDYIIAHGVYSWVSPEVRDKVLQICKQNLAPNGIAYVSYNTYPGWHMMGIIRDAMCYHTRRLTEPSERAAQGRAMLDFLAEFASTENTAYGHLLKVYSEFLEGELKGASSRGDALLLRDELAEFNAPVYFHQFVERAARHGLQYLVEANFPTVFLDNVSPEVKQALRGMAQDPIELEQYMDFLRNRSFRQTLLCHDAIRLLPTLAPDQVNGLYVTSRARPVADDPDIQGATIEQFQCPNGATLSIDHPVSKAAMLCLAEMWPQAVLFEGLLSSARLRLGEPVEPEAGSADLERDSYVLAANLLRAYGYSPHLVGLHTCVPPLVRKVSEHPVASPVARLQAADSAVVTNLWHERVGLDGLQRHLLRSLDGTRDRTALLDGLTTLAAEGALTMRQRDQSVADDSVDRTILAEGLEQRLQLLAQAALLIS
jgi:methyltransferase-like protein/SAM-dependent methyltransferase